MCVALDGVGYGVMTASMVVDGSIISRLFNKMIHYNTGLSAGAPDEVRGAVVPLAAGERWR